jgi:hypothetical protein
MNVSQPTDKKALVTVFDDMPSAASAVIALRKSGFADRSLELVTYDLDDEAPDLITPSGTEKTGSCLADGVVAGGSAGVGMGAVAGAIATLITGFPGLGLGMIFGAGLTGAIVGGMAGVDRAVHDDSVDLPSIQDYESLIAQGKKLVVIHGSHQQVIAAREIIANLPHINSHLHPIGGHQFHEHPDS